MKPNVKRIRALAFWIVLLACCFPVVVSAQEDMRKKGYEGNVELFVGPGKGARYQNPFTFGLQMVNGYRFGRVFTAGLGVGLLTDYGYPWLLPIYLDTRFDLADSPIRPFIQIALGYSLGTVMNRNFSFQTQVGGRIPLSNKLGLITGVAVRYQHHGLEYRGAIQDDAYVFVEYRLGVAF